MFSFKNITLDNLRPNGRALQSIPKHYYNTDTADQQSRWQGFLFLLPYTQTMTSVSLSYTHHFGQRLIP